MNYLLKVIFLSLFLLILGPESYSKAAGLNPKTVSLKLEKALNTNNFDLLNGIISESEVQSLKNRYQKFSELFPKTNWTVNHLKTQDSSSMRIEVITTGKSIHGNRNQFLNAQQIIILKISGDKIIKKKVISQHSIIQNSKKPISINLKAPEYALTGSVYDIDLILIKPLGNRAIAGGLIPLTNEQLDSQNYPPIKIRPLSGGGLFKSVKAPLNPGVQHWAMVIAHPDSIISATKMVNIVSHTEPKGK